MAVSLLELQERLNDYGWLDEHLDMLFRQITDDLQYPPTAQRAIECLNLVMPYALTRHDYGRWLNPLYDALLHGMVLKDDEIQIQIWAHLGNCLFLKGDYESSITTLEKALERGLRESTPEILMLARIGMLRTKTIFAAHDIHAFIRDTLEAARQITDYHLLGKLHHTLAVAYCHQGETQKGLGHGQMALAYWYHENNAIEKERAILALAEACRVANRYEQAARFLDLIHPGSEDRYMSGIFYYHLGSTLLETDQLEEAHAALEQALRQFRKLDFPYMTGATHHALGLVQTKLDQNEAARDNLRRALIMWQELNFLLQQVSCIYALGFLEERLKHNEEARELYTRALELSDALPLTPTLSDLRKELAEHLRTVSQ